MSVAVHESFLAVYMYESFQHATYVALGFLRFRQNFFFAFNPKLRRDVSTFKNQVWSYAADRSKQAILSDRI